ncbi:hypothetical protein, partial [Treponema socranskii]|uniref:hypothetical protein n=1 Tax=Treponema socranskii TaxID=53419 RepID=UPI0023F18CB6
SDYGLPRRTAGLLPGVQPVFYITRYFLEDITSVRLTWFLYFFPFFCYIKISIFSIIQTNILKIIKGKA